MSQPARVELAELFAEQVHCPDCHSDAVFTQSAPGVFVLDIAHDDTCPTWRATQPQETT